MLKSVDLHLLYHSAYTKVKLILVDLLNKQKKLAHVRLRILVLITLLIAGTLGCSTPCGVETKRR